MPSDFVHLHVHTEFSLLDGQSKISHIMKRAQELEMPAVGISDHGVMFGVIDFAKKAEAANIKPVIGMEAYLAPRGMQDRDAQQDKRPYHLLLWAENQVGYRNLLKIASASQLEGYYYRPRIDRAFLADHAEGIIATSGCLAAQVPRLLEEQGEERAREMIGWYQDVFGAENFFLELQPHDIAELKRLNAWLLQYRKSGHTPVQLLATNDMHYVRASDTETHDVLLAIQTGALVKETNRMQLSPLGSYYMKSADEMRQAFTGIDNDLLNEAFANTLAIAERCKVSLKREKYHLPLFPVPEGMTQGAYLRHLAFLGLSWRFPNRESDPILQERLERELFIIDDLGFNTYFLIVWDLCMFARSADIWWNVRGSGAGSLVAYCLGITNLDPIQNSLLFERFLNPGRKTMPDIDLDYPDDRRGEMIAYAVDKYGEDKVAAIITFGTMGAKAAVRDVARVLDVPLDKVNRAVKLIPTEAKQKPIMEYVEAEPDLKRMYQTDPELRRAIDTAIELQGMTRHASTHAAGVIIADAPLVEYLPLHRITGTDPSGGSLKSVTQFPMETAEEIGLLKVDFLGLSTLTILRKACELIERHHGIRYTMDNIPYRHDDDNISDEQRAMLDRAFEMMGRGDTVGVFQVESSGMQSMLRDMRPKTFEHIIAGISLYRPGPMDFIPLFNRRMHGEEAVHYHHERLAGILGETYGICLTGDTLVYNAQTGISERLDALGSRVDSFMVQAVNEAFEPVRVPMTAWYDNGVKPVYELRLQNGACVKATADHRFLTEDGWRELQHLALGSYIATPAKLYEPIACDDTPREKLRVLAYLLADGGVSNVAQVNFFSKSPELLEEYERCLGAFEDVQAKRIEQVRSVTRIVVRDRKGRYENSLLAWMRALGLKNPASAPTGGKHSHDKFIPDFVFALSDADVAFFLASLWDCDGYMGNKFCHYKTISRVLAYGVQTLLLRLGIESSIYAYTYQNLKRGQQTSYQVSVYDTRRLADYLQPHMMTSKRLVECTNTSTSTLNRRDFIAEVYECTGLSARKIMATYKIDRQHFYAKRLNCERIGHKVVQEIAETVPLPETKRRLCLNWNKVVAIEPVGEVRVYDITVPQVHNFVANNILVHNCVYQEQIMQIAGEMFGYSLGEADLMRRAVSKKKDKDLLEHRALFRERAPQNGISVDVADKIFDDIVFFANYGFNKCVVGETQIVDADTGRYVTVEDLYYGRVTLSKTLSLDTETLQIGAQAVTHVMFNGVKPVYRLTTRTGRTIEATDNHPFYTFEGWKLLRDVAIGEHIAGVRRENLVGKLTWNDHEVIVLGHLLAEGNLCHPYGIYYYTNDPVQADDYTSNAEKFANTLTHTHKRRDNAHDVYAKRRIRQEPCGLTVWIEALGLRHKNSHNKFVPSEAFQLEPRQIGLLLARMWEGDGHVNETSRNLFYATSSERLARDVQMLLLRLDIPASLRRVTFPYKEGRLGYQVFVTRNDNIRRFQRWIGTHFLSEERRQRLNNILETYQETTASRDLIPIGIKSIVRELKDVSGKKWRQIADETKLSMSSFHREASGKKMGYSYETIACLADYFQSPALARYTSSDILWDEVVEVVYVGEKPTYDLTIENTHNFIANGIVVHNSHASDYAVITVQTAYLKCHYPHEYMTALLSVQFDDSDKVATFLEECRRLNIPILPPDINASQLEFDIERLPDGRRGVRFGLSAVKNAGVNALNVILEARQEGGRFTSLLDLCHRVDLHKVGKRALECLIKVGALEAFGERDILLESLERIMTASTTYHKAKQSGQKSLFGEEADVGMSEITLITPRVRVARRDMLIWEKELLGLYVTGRPVDKFAAQLRHLPNLLNVADLRAEETFKARAVNIAGEVVGMRRIQTKSHETMVVMQIEDWHESAGTIEVVLFPKTWEKVNITFQAENDRPLDVGEIVLVRGMLDNKRGDVQVLADSVTADFDVMMPDQPQASYRADAPAWMDKGEEGQFVASSADEPPPLFAESAPAALAPLHTPAWANAPAEPDAPSLFDDEEGATLPQKVVIVFKVNGDEARDMARFKRLKQVLIAERGTQAVEVVLVYDDRKKRFKMAETVDYSEKLLAKLRNIDNVQAVYLEDDKA